MHQSVRDYWITFNEPLEGRVDWLYLDQKGWVSTGVGNKIDQTARPNSPPSEQERAQSLSLAAELRWLNETGAEATADEVAAAWDAVKARLDLAPRGHTAFGSLTRLRLPPAEIDRHVFVKLDQMEAFLLRRPEFGDFSSWPANAQLATLSMCWALGPGFRFPRFQQHVAARDWTGAADECRFQPDEGTIRVRNALDRKHFELARVVDEQGLPAERIVLDLSDAFGVQGALLALGYRPGGQDGQDGPRTRAAVTAFQAACGTAQNGAWHDAQTRAALASRLDAEGFTVIGT